MGAKCIYSVTIEGTSPAMAERELIRRVEAHTGRKVGDWEVSLTFFALPDKKRPPLEIISFSDLPARAFILVNSMVTEAEHGIIQLIRKVSTYQQRYVRSVKGTEYDFVDFCVRVGLAFDRHNAATGVVVEIEYRPCPVIDDCEKLIGDLMERLAAPLVPPPQTSVDTSVSVAATTAYSFARVELEAKKVNAKDLVPFSKRTAALLYGKLLRT